MNVQQNGSKDGGFITDELKRKSHRTFLLQLVRRSLAPIYGCHTIITIYVQKSLQ